MCSMTITILLSRRIIRSVPLLKGKKAEAPSLPDDPPIGLHTVSCNCPSFNRPTIRSPIQKKKKKEEERPLSSFEKDLEKNSSLPSSSLNPIQNPLKMKSYIGEKLLIRGRIVKICWLLNHFSLLKISSFSCYIQRYIFFFLSTKQ